MFSGTYVTVRRRHDPMMLIRYATVEEFITHIVERGRGAEECTGADPHISG